MQFYSWQKYTPVGSLMVEPKWIQWDPDVTVAALAYADSLVLCRARPTFKAIASLSIQVRRDLTSLGHTAANVRQVPCHKDQLECPRHGEDVLCMLAPGTCCLPAGLMAKAVFS